MCCCFVFFCNDTTTTEIYTYCHPLSLPDALPIFSNLITDPDDVVNAKLDWNKVADLSLDVSFFGKNLFKEKYIIGPGVTPANAIPVSTALFAPPRTYGIQVRYRFGASR